MSIWLEAIWILCLTGPGWAIAVPALRLRIVATARENFDMVRFPFFDRRRNTCPVRRKFVCLPKTKYAASQHDKMNYLHMQMRMMHGPSADLPSLYGTVRGERRVGREA
jgi:hypothetical protein